MQLIPDLTLILNGTLMCLFLCQQQIGDLLVNITKHTGQPKIEVLTKEEKEKLMSEHALEDKQVWLSSSHRFSPFFCMLCFKWISLFVFSFPL